jgi:hypothetical protein
MSNFFDFQVDPSKKWRLVLLVVLMASLGTIVPPILSIWVFKAVTPLVIISGTEYVSLLTLIVSAYFGANVLQKQVQKDSSLPGTTVDSSKVETSEEKEA